MSLEAINEKKIHNISSEMTFTILKCYRLLVIETSFSYFLKAK